MVRIIFPFLVLFVSSCNNFNNDSIETYFSNQADIIIRSSSYETLLSDLEQIILKHETLKLSVSDIELISNNILENAIDSTIYLSLFKKKEFEFQIIGQYKAQTKDSLLKQKKLNKNLIVNLNDSIWEVFTDNFKIVSNNKLHLNNNNYEGENRILNKFVNSNKNFVFTKNNTFTDKFLPQSISNLFKGDCYFNQMIIPIKFMLMAL